MLITCQNPEEVVKEACWLAWNACGSPQGMGFFRSKPTASKDDVWNNIQTAGDYPGRGPNAQKSVHADYVFGRMMKLRLEWDEDGIEIPNTEPQMNYQSWCCVYPTYEALIQAAITPLADAGEPGA